MIRKVKSVSVVFLFGYKKQGDKKMVYIEVVPDSNGWFSIPRLTFYDSLETRFSQIYRDLKFDEYKISYHFSDVPPLDKISVPSLEEQRLNNTNINNPGYYLRSRLLYRQ
ncbi:hypothetical protein ABE426_11425 [Sphingobacterium faecium]|uniref:hypothetical protein n=1 Tax=Sphingobacterium faecium TaxID=34087 RepID=UPI0032090B32